MEEVYRDLNGYWAYLRVLIDGTARLTVYKPNGWICHARSYKTRRGALIAMWKLSESWERRK